MKCPHLDRYVKVTGMMLKLSVVSWLVLAASRWIEGSDLICSGKSWWCVVPSRRPDGRFFCSRRGLVGRCSPIMAGVRYNHATGVKELKLSPTVGFPG